MKMNRLRILFLCFAIATAACSKPEGGKTSPSGELKPEPAHSGAAPEMKPETGLKFTPPPGWISEAPTSTSRRAQYKLPRVEGDPEDAELIVYYFQGGGGTPEANVERWIGQFTAPGGKPASSTAKIAHKSVGNIKLTVVDVSGTYSNSMGPMQMGGSPKAGFRMLGAIAETDQGPWFIKLTGPERTVARWEPSFDSFLNSIKQ